MVQLLASSLQKLEGKMLEVSGRCIRFKEGLNGRPAAWAGGEGYAAPVTLPDDETYFLKLYRLPSSERRARVAFLAAIDLGSLPLRQKPFEAAPTWPVSDAIDIPDEGKVQVEGHLARSISGTRFDTLMQEGWQPCFEARVSLARQLCCAVEVLEGAGIVHGDISASNVMVVDKEAARPGLRLIDFDGFHHPEVAAVPYTDKERGGRAWGTPGYRAPAFKRRPDVLVTSDRVAMAILAMELVTLRHDDDLPEDTFLGQSSIDARDPLLSSEISSRWARGWDLVRRAIAEEDPARAPSPLDFRRALGRLLAGAAGASVPPPAPKSITPSLLVRVRDNAQMDHQLKLRGRRGSFAPVSQAFGWLSYELTSAGVHLRGEPPVVDGRPTPLFVRHGGPSADSVRYDRDIEVDVAAGDVVLWDDFQVYML